MAGCRTGPIRCRFGYASDAAVLEALGSIDLDADFVVIHLNEPDTTSHLYGPDSPEAMEQYRSTDAAYGEVIARFTEGWDDTIVFTLSDHDQETITDGELVDLGAALRAVDGVDVAHEGTAALVHVAPDASSPADDHLLEMIRAVPGVEATAPVAPDVWMTWTEPGRAFAGPPIPLGGQHGSPRCRTQMAIVSGGDRRVGGLARRIERCQPSALDWAPTIAELLELDGAGA